MGLLTDPGIEKSALPATLYSHHKFLAISFYIVGLIWFLSLSHVALNHSTYFSENALLPGLVQGEFVGDFEAIQYLNSLKAEVEQTQDKMPYSWLLAQFTQLGLDTYSHNFSLHYPLRDKVFEGRNVYAILRAVRGSSTESLVLSTPFRPVNAVLQKTYGSIALMLALAKFFSEQIYWAKDIIFLVTEHEQLGAQAWLEAYHRSSCGSGILKYGDLPGRAGPIQAAINLEIDDLMISHLDVKIEGLNGQLPNLDLVNLVHRLCHRENVQHTFKNNRDPARPESYKGWLQNFKTLLAMIATQATGVPNGNHGLYHRFGVASVTLEGIKEDGRMSRSAHLLQVGRVLEGICRSLNNLLERFHQSFFFFLLPATNRYISIGVYMPPFAVLCSSVLAVALSLWYSTSCASNDQEKLTNSPDNANKVDYTILEKIPVFVVVHLLGIGSYYCIDFLAQSGINMGLSTERSVSLSLLALSFCSLCTPLFIFKAVDFSRSSWEVLKCLAVLELAVVTFSCSILNFSLAFIIASTYGPLALISSPFPGWVKKIGKILFLLLVHPITLSWIFVSIDSYVNFSDIPLSILMKRSVDATGRALTYSIIDGHIYGNWLFSLVCVCMLPLWSSFWIIIFHPNKLTTMSIILDNNTKDSSSNKSKID